MTPKEVLYARASRFQSGDYGGVYTLYAKESEFRMYFTEITHYLEHAGQVHCHEAEFVQMHIIHERVRGNLAEITYTERFLEGTPEKHEVRYHTRTILKAEEGVWRILKETREKTG